ncbi:hypothetical protein GCM10010403_40120 [Glycomyces rutgersensis]|uniref:DUF4190 domain-containing protein n=1 Tax=Glycomyces rutgersensis TaxID=58115 RepID=A0ABN3G2S5_9ACTN
MYYPPPYPPPYPPRRGNGFGAASLVFGLIGLLIFSWIPVLNIFIGIPVALLAVIFGIVGLATSGSRAGDGSGTGGTGLILGLLTIVIAIGMWAWIFDAT